MNKLTYYHGGFLPSRRQETSAVSCILGFRNFRKFVTSKSEKGGTPVCL